MSSATDIVNPDVDSFCWAATGWEDAAWCSVQDARNGTTRGAAAGAFASETGNRLTDVRVWKRYVRAFSRQDIWDGPGRDRWVDHQDWEHFHAHGTHLDLGELFAKAPAEPPEDWQPSEGDAVWQFVPRAHPEATPVWICGFPGDEPPHDPSRTAPSLEERP